jgi:hypothetical protein
VTVADDILKVDWDAHAEALTVNDVCGRLRRAGYRIRWWKEEYSPSGRGRHLTLQLTPKPRTPMEVVALQALLASDPYREACNVQRVRLLPKISRHWRKRWNVFYGRG